MSDEEKVGEAKIEERETGPQLSDSEADNEHAVFEEQALLRELQREQEAFAYTAKAFKPLLSAVPKLSDIDAKQFTKIYDIEMAVVKLTREIESMRREQLKLLRDAEKAVKEIKDTNIIDPEKVQEYKQKVVATAELLQRLRIGYAMPEIYQRNFKELRWQQAELLRKEKGIEQYSDFRKEHDEVQKELKHLEDNVGPLANIFLPRKLRRLKERSRELGAIQGLYKDLPIPRFKREMFDKIDTLVFEVVRDASRKMTSRFDHEITRITRLDQEKNKPNEKAVDAFNDEFIKAEFLPVIKEWIRAFDGQYQHEGIKAQIKWLSDPENVRKLTDLLKRGFKVPAEGPFGGTTEAKAAIDNEIQRLKNGEEVPYNIFHRMENMLRSPQRRPGEPPTQYPPDHAYTDFSDAASLLGPKKKLSLVHAQAEFMDDLAKQVEQSVKERKHADRWDNSMYRWSIQHDLDALRDGAAKGVQSDSSILQSIDGSKEIITIVERFDIERWTAYRGLPEVREKFGDGTIASIEAIARAKVLNEVYAPEGDSAKASSQTNVERLARHFRDFETIPIVFIASYRNPNIASPGGSIRQTLPYKILASLTPEQHQELEEQPIPGLKEFIRLMMADPNAPNHEEHTNDDRSKTKNPNYLPMREALVKMCIEFPAKNPKQQEFLARSVQAFHAYLTEDSCNLLLKLAQDLKDPNKRMQGLGALFDGALSRNLNAVRAILRYYELFSGPPENKELKFNEAKLFGAFITGGVCQANEEDLAILSRIYYETPERLRAAIDFGSAQVDSGRSSVHVFNFTSVDDIKRFIDFAYIPGALEFLKGLHDIHAGFGMEDVPMLTELAIKKEEFFADIAEIHKRFPYFQYSLHQYEKSDPKTGEKSYIKVGDPYEVLAHKQAGSGNFLGPWLTGDEKVEKIPDKFAAGFMRAMRQLDNTTTADITAKGAKQFTASLQKFITYVKQERAAKRLTEEQTNVWDKYLLFQHLARYPEQVEIVTHFSQLAPELLNEKKKPLADYIFKNFALLVHSKADLVFINKIVAVYGGAATQLVEDYKNCLEKGILGYEEENKEIVEEILEQFRNLSPEIVQGYIEARRSGSGEVYLAGLRSVAERLTGSGEIAPAERGKPYFQALISATYQNNSNQWTSYENNESCADRSADLASFKIQPRYVIDLLSASKISLREGVTRDTAGTEALKNRILSISQRAAEVGYDPAKMLERITEKTDALLKPLLAAGGKFENIDPNDLETIDENFFLLLIGSQQNTADTNSIEEIKSLLIEYEFAVFEDVREYVAGTADRVRRANNQDYALLCELNTFFADRIKEVNRRLIEAGFGNVILAPVLENIFYDASRRAAAEDQQSRRDRLQVTKLGLSDEFVGQIARVLRGKTKREYPPEKVREIIAQYEARTGGLSDKSTESSKSRTRAFYGQLKSQRERTAAAVEQLTGQEIDLKTVRLGELNVEELLKTQAAIREGTYNQDQFAAYTLERFLNLFEKEKELLETELGKFQSEGGKDREVLNGYIAKSKESAHARMVGGVCVSGDNPKKVGENCQWNLPNYFQMVFQDPETLRCQGAVLLHHFTEPDGKKILTASINPSSTYLYGVDERALFRGILSQLETFARENNFNVIALSKNKQIRTNRTGGEFEKEMDEAVARANKEFKFAEVKTFSFSPSYNIQDMDVVWER